MENKICYIKNEPFDIRAEKILNVMFTSGNKLGIFQLCSNMRGFTYFKAEDEERGRSALTSVGGKKMPLSVKNRLGFLVVFSFFILPVVSRKDCNSMILWLALKATGFLYSKINTQRGLT